MSARYVSPKEYKEETGTKMGIEQIKRLCDAGKLEHRKTDGGHYQILLRDADSVSRTEYEALQTKCAKLEEKLRIINQASSL